MLRSLVSFIVTFPKNFSTIFIFFALPQNAVPHLVHHIDTFEVFLRNYMHRYAEFLRVIGHFNPVSLLVMQHEAIQRTRTSLFFEERFYDNV